MNVLLTSQSSMNAPVVYRCQCNLEFTEDLLADCEGQLYCEECLVKQLAMEKLEVQRLEEKFIFYKEYEASVSTGEIAYLKQLQANEPSDE